MKRRILTLILAIAMLSGVAIIATADTPGNTQGSIEFRSGSIIITPPDPPPAGDCFCCPTCPCTCECSGGSDPSCCPCTCDDKDDYDNFFRKHRVANNLYFGDHSIMAYGIFDSANKLENSALKYGDHNTTRTGEYTGVEVENQTPGHARITVSISGFIADVSGTPTPTLGGFKLRLLPEAAIMREGTTSGSPLTGGVEILPGANFRGGDGELVELTVSGGAVPILIVGPTREVKAAWHGLLDIAIEVPRHPGEAQAILTWTGENVG